MTVLLLTAAQSAHAGGITMIYPENGAINVPAGTTIISWTGGNGSYNYTLSGNSEYGASSSSGSISIIGANPSIEANLLPGTTYELTIVSGRSYGVFHFTTADPVKVSGISMTEKELTITEGETGYLDYTISPSDAYDTKVTWKSSNTGVASVNSWGEIKAVAPGNATITATTRDGGYQAHCNVTVKSAAVAVTGITLAESEISLVEGNKKELRYTILPSNATDKTVTWRSSNSGVASVDGSGVVSAVSPGNATITAATKDGDYQAYCTITVEKAVVNVTGIILDKSVLNLIKGKKAKLTATVLPHDATNKNILWSSNNTAAATVSGTGEVSAAGVGSAVITAMTEDGGYSAEANVYVDKITPVIESAPAASAITEGMPLEESVLSGGSVFHEGKEVEGSFRWEDPTIIPTLADSAKTKYSVVFHAADGASYNNVHTTTTLEIKKAPVAVTGVALNKESADIFKGNKLKLIATVTPDNATNKNLSWSSEDDGIAAVDANGIVSGVAAGKTNVTVTTVDGGFSASTTVNVWKKTPEITLKPTASAISEGSPLKESVITGGTAVHRETVVPGAFVWKAPSIIPTLDDSMKTEYEVVFKPTDGKTYNEASTKIRVEVKKVVIAVTGVKISSPSMLLKIGDIGTLSAAVRPENATNKAVSWKSSNDNVAKVDAAGNVSALAEGSATITVVAEDGGFADNCHVSVSRIPVTGISLSKETLELNEGMSATIHATITPEKATNKSLLWSSADEKIATVDDKGNVKAVASGVTEITATTVDGGFSAKCRITVRHYSDGGGSGGCDYGLGWLALFAVVPLFKRRKTR